MKKIIYFLLVLSFIFPATTSTKTEQIREYPLIVCSVKFPDQPNIHDFSWVTNQLFGEDNQSLDDFFWQCSTGTTKVVDGKFKGLQWYEAKNKLSYYAEDTQQNFDIRVRELIIEALTKALDNGLKPEDYEFYDKDWDTSYSQACVIVTGDQEGYQNFPRSDAFWPHASAVEVPYKGKTYLFRYFLACEGIATTSVGLDLAWTASHEYGHVMGLWDLYNYGCGGPFGGTCSYPVTYFDIMAARHKGQGMLGYHRERLGFITPQEVTTSGEYILKPITTNDSQCYLKVMIPGTQEYYGVEFRKRIGIDSFWDGIPSEGMLIYHVSDDPRYGGENMNSGTDGYYLLEILNPGKTKWHEKACYSIESGHTTASAKTDPSTVPYSPEYKQNVKIEIVSKLGDTIKVRVTYSPREILSTVLNTNRVFVGSLHNTHLNSFVLNTGTDPVTITGSNCDIGNPVTIESRKAQKVGIKLRLPTEQIPKTFEERTLGFESENQFHRLKIVMINIVYALDTNHDGTVSLEEVENVASAVGRPKKIDQDYDFNGSGEIEAEDLMIASRYVGYKTQ